MIQLLRFSHLPQGRISESLKCQLLKVKSTANTEVSPATVSFISSPNTPGEELCVTNQNGCEGDYYNAGRLKLQTC